MKSNSKMKDPLQVLKTIKDVEAPAFLYTRIQAKIEKGRLVASESINYSLIKIAFATITLLFALNIGVFLKSNRSHSASSQIETSTNSYLYYLNYSTLSYE